MGLEEKARKIHKFGTPQQHETKEITGTWIVQEKRKGQLANTQIAQSMKVSVRWVQKLWARHRNHTIQDISHPAHMGRPKNSMPGRREHSAVLAVRCQEHLGAANIQDAVRDQTGINIPHNTIHRILRDEDMASEESRKGKKRRWVRYERTYSNSLWHTDYKLLDDGRWFLCYEDDASRFVTGYGMFDNATTENALRVLDQAIRNHGKPAAVMTDHGSQFYANEKEVKARGAQAGLKKG